MFDQCLHSLFLVWRESLVGGAVVIGFTLAGWRIGGVRDRRLVHVVAWWLQHVVGPLLASRSWARRAAIIAANNSLICAATVALGALGHIAWLGVAGIGLGLGVAIRLMMAGPIPGRGNVEAPAPRRPILQGLGLGLNLLEVPAIMLSAGLSLTQGAMSSDLGTKAALGTFALLVFPLLVVSAAGEALWMTTDPEFPGLWRHAVSRRGDLREQGSI